MGLAYRIAVAKKRFVPDPLRRWLGAQLAGWTVAQWRRDEAQVVRALGTTVAAGPFVGMRYLDWAWGDALGPKRAGTYELEIADALEAAIAENRRASDHGTAIDGRQHARVVTPTGRDPR